MPVLLESWHSPPLLNEVQTGHLVHVFLISSFNFAASGGGFIHSFCRTLGNRFINRQTVRRGQNRCSEILPARNRFEKECAEGVADAEVTPGYFSNLALSPPPPVSEPFPAGGTLLWGSSLGWWKGDICPFLGRAALAGCARILEQHVEGGHRRSLFSCWEKGCKIRFPP